MLFGATVAAAVLWQRAFGTVMVSPASAAILVALFAVAVTIFGKNVASTAAKTQCVKLPSACPSARWWLGKISEMNTQITVPCPIA